MRKELENPARKGGALALCTPRTQGSAHALCTPPLPCPAHGTPWPPSLSPPAADSQFFFVKKKDGE